MSRVYVCHHNGLSRKPIDISDATRFGDLITVFGREVFPDEADDVMPETVQRAKVILAGFDPDVDYLALIGSPLHIALCSAAIVQRGINCYRVLRYDRENRGYYPITIDLQ